MEEEQKFEIQGGSLEKSLSGETKVDLKALAQEAWDLSKTTKRGVLQGAMLLVMIFILLVLVLQSWFGVTQLEGAPPRMITTLQILFTILTAPVIASMLLLGLSHSVGLKPKFMPLLLKLMGSASVILLALLVAAMVDIGMKLLFIPGIYLGMATGFSMMLLIEKKLAPSQAILQSIKVFNRYWAVLTLFYIGSLILFVIGSFSFGVAYIWLIPFYFNFKGVLYRELFGVSVAKSHNNTTSDESVFHA